ncbi:30S ribosomal protein S8 [Patescibacteria group bacterium]|jgi:small subunit ribosomal protein S8|nr:30S ribosomal protein S8 [Patescibacteria group bacterium]
MVGDPVGDFIVRLTNAGAVRKEIVSLPYSQLKHAIADKLKERGYITEAVKQGKKVKKTLDVTLRYNADGSAFIQGVSRVSKPGRRLYVKSSEIFPVKFGKGTMILSTPEGILAGDEARKKKVGGENLFIIW